MIATKCKLSLNSHIKLSMLDVARMQLHFTPWVWSMEFQKLKWFWRVLNKVFEHTYTWQLILWDFSYILMLSLFLGISLIIYYAYHTPTTYCEETILRTLEGFLYLTSASSDLLSAHLYIYLLLCNKCSEILNYALKYLTKLFSEY